MCGNFVGLDIKTQDRDSIHGRCRGPKKYADAVFCFANNLTAKEHVTYSVYFSSANDLEYTIFRKRLTLPQRRTGRNTGSAA